MKVLYPSEAVCARHSIGYCLNYIPRIRGRGVVEGVDWVQSLMFIEPCIILIVE